MATAARRQLTAADRAKPFAKYFDAPLAPAPKEIFELLDKGPVDPASALPVHHTMNCSSPAIFRSSAATA